jgi:hypothetical protein
LKAPPRSILAPGSGNGFANGAELISILYGARTCHDHHLVAAYPHVADPDHRGLGIMVSSHLGIRRGYRTQLGHAWHRLDLSGKTLRFGTDQPDVCLVTDLADQQSAPATFDESDNTCLLLEGTIEVEDHDHAGTLPGRSTSRKAPGSSPRLRASIRALPTMTPSTWGARAVT